MDTQSVTFIDPNPPGAVEELLLRMVVDRIVALDQLEGEKN